MSKETSKASDGGPGSVTGAAPAGDGQEFFSKVETAKRLGKSLRTLDRWMDAGYVPYFKVGTGILFRWEDVFKALKERFELGAAKKKGRKAA